MSHQHHDPQVCNSHNYVWSTRDRLGYGATGTVYVGYNKSNGERVAVKVFTGSTEFKSLKREIDVVRSLPSHENIVMLFGDEEELKYKQKVIIMELCTGGSLYEVIDSPENAYGLDESQFKQLIYDVAKGLSHLRANNFVHRDIKPGNIMRCGTQDGSYVFKLADFGTARELRADETFISLHGTEEYLYPGMYERALVNPTKRHQFSAQVDLWSVGATFFHAATGRLPFQPFRKRDDKKLMYHMISSKKSGVISGWQLEPNGDILYSETLPNDTIISDGLKNLITPVLAGLLESDIVKMSSFENFFATIENISKMKVVDVFCVYSCTCHKIYINPDEPDGVSRLKLLIKEQTDLDPHYQELFYENLPYRPGHAVMASKLPTTTGERPMFMFGGSVKKTAELKSPILPSIPSIPQGFGLSSDVMFAKECAKVMWSLKFYTEQIERMFRLMHQAALCYSHTLNHEYQLVVQQLQSLQQVNEAICRVLTSQISGIMSLKELVAAANQVTEQKFRDDIQLLSDEITAKQKSLYEFSEAPRQMRDKVSQLKGEIGEKTSWDSKYCSELFHRSVETLHFLVRSVDSNYKTFLKEKKHKSMSPHDQKVHEFTKIKLHQKLVEAQEKVVGYLTGREQVYSKLGDWFTRLIPVRKDIEVVGCKMTKHSEECGQHLQAQNIWETNFQHKISTLCQKVTAVLSQHTPNSGSGGGRGVEATDGNTTSLEMQRSVLAKLRSFNSSVEQDLNEQRTKLERLNISTSHYHT